MDSYRKPFYSTREERDPPEFPCGVNCPRYYDGDRDALDASACEHFYACETIAWGNLNKHVSRFHSNKYIRRRRSQNRQTDDEL